MNDKMYISDKKAMRELINTSPNKVFSVHFWKNMTKTAKEAPELRHMVARLGVKKHLKGGDKTTAHCNYLLTAFDMQKNAYRCINLETIQKLKVLGDEYNHIPEKVN